MPINLLGGEDEKHELTSEKKEKKQQAAEMTRPTEETDTEEKAGGISAFVKREDKKQAPEPEPKPEKSTPKEPKPEQSKLEKKDRPQKKERPQKEKPAPEPDGFDISLMPSKLMVIPRTVRSSLLVLIAVLVVVGTILSLIWLYTNWHFEKIAMRVHNIKVEMQLLEAKSTFYLETRDEIAALEKKAVRVENILNNHIYWTKFFTLLESYTITNVYFGDFSAGVSDNIHLNVVAKDLTSLAQQLVSFKTADDFVKQAEVSGIRKIPDGIAAAFDLTLVDDVFYK